MKTMIKTLLATTVAVATLSVAAGANAAVVVNITQAGADVLATTTGTLNLAGLSADPSFTLDRGIYPSVAYVATGANDGAGVTGYAGLTGGAASFGPSSTYSVATSGTGRSFAINGSGFGTPYVFVPTNYVSGTSLGGTSTFAGQTLASLGLTSGSYVFRSANDTVTVNIGAAVPETATWGMMIAGFGMMGAALRTRRRSAVSFA